MQIARTLLGLVSLSHVVAPLALQLDAGRSAHDGVAGATAIHAPLLVLTLVLVSRLASGRPWTRRMTTASQLLSMLFGIVLWSSTTTYQPIVPVVAALQVAIVVLLWSPPTARLFFTSTPSSRSAIDSSQ